MGSPGVDDDGGGEGGEGEPGEGEGPRGVHQDHLLQGQAEVPPQGHHPTLHWNAAIYSNPFNKRMPEIFHHTIY